MYVKSCNGCGEKCIGESGDDTLRHTVIERIEIFTSFLKGRKCSPINRKYCQPLSKI